MAWHLTASIALCLLSIGAANGQTPAAATNGNYAVVCSRTLRPGVPFHVGVTVFPRSTGQSIQSVTARLNCTRVGSKFKHVNLVATWQRKSGDDRNAVDLELLAEGGPSDYDSLGSYKLMVKIEDTLGNTYSNSTDVTLTYFPVTTLIQTDKAVYKPGQKVKFRIVNLDQTLKPVLTSMDVLIKDSRNNLVDKQNHNLSALTAWSDKVVMTGELQLSDMPNEGDWSITVKSGHGTESKTFSVWQYVLPKFTLELTEPSFVHFNDTEFTVRAKVAYTFDKAVEGTFNATIGPFMNCMSCKEKYDQLNKYSAVAPADGAVNFTFNIASWRKGLRSKNYLSRPVFFMAQASVQFKEKFTGETKLAEKTFYIYTKRYDVKVVTSQVPFFLPGFEVPVQINLVRPDNKPFTGTAASNVKVSITYQQRAKKRVKEVFRGPLSVSPSGTGTSLLVKIPADSDFHPVEVTATISGDEKTTLSDTSSVNPFIAVTNEYVKVSAKTSSDALEMEIAKSDGIQASNVFYAVLSRGQLQRWGQYSSTSLKFSKAELAGFVSDVTVIAFGLDSTGEVVASSLKHQISRYGGKVELKSNLTTDKGEPQQWASVGVAAEPETFVFVTGIDTSVNLLATGQDILQSTLAARFNSNLQGSRYWPRYHRLTTARIIQENDLAFLSDAFYYAETAGRGDVMYSSARSRTMNRDFMAAPAPMAVAQPESISGSGGKTQVRKFFPETMIWTLVKTDSEGKARHSFLLPDTITSWDITAFGVSSDKQIQTMDQAFKITTFKNFFIRPVLPYSLVRGEKFLLKVLVFNYREIAGQVAVSLNFTESAADAGVASDQAILSRSAIDRSKMPPGIDVSVKPNSVGVAIFELTPRALPSLDISIKATFSGQGGVAETDVVVKSIVIVPEGKTVYKSRSVLLSAPASGAARAEQTVSIDFPTDSADLVSGSEVFSYSIIGDVMGPAMQNIGSLLRLPSGCGEQNMVNFAPAVFIWEYLSNTKQENSEVKEKALNVMKVGLQRQLTYKRYDGSYSAFGDNDEAGSAWLTAFVLSIYARASAFITIEPNALTGDSVQFLLQRQASNGQFTELPGSRVLDRSLQGSSAKSSHGMTAFICLALLDIDDAARTRPEIQSTLWKDMDVKGSITKCLWFVKSAFESKPDSFSSYDVALASYLMRRAQATTIYRQASLQRCDESLQAALNARAETSASGEKFWTTTDPFWNRKIGSVETSAWALLSATLAGNTDESLLLLRWLSNQQTDIGGFQTSQATVVGIRALSAFAAKSALVSGDATVEVVVNGETKRVSVVESRRLVLQQSQLVRGASARVGSAVVRHSGGTGFALVTVSWQYNMVDKQPLSAEWKLANGLGIRLGEDVLHPPPKDQLRFNVCAKASESEGMLILRVTNPSGYSAIQLPQPSQVSGLKRVESGPQEIVLYFDFISTDGICVPLWWVREVVVLELSPQLISLQKYYNTEQIVSASYLAPELKSLTKCKACPDCPGCQSKETWLTWLI